MSVIVSFSNFFKQNFAHCPGGVCEAGNWRLLYVTPAMADFFDLPSEPGPDFLDEWFAQGILETVEESGDRNGGSLLFRHATGRSCLIDWREGEDEAGQRLRCFVIHPFSFSGIHSACQNLFREMDNILDFIHDGIWVIDGHGITLRINRAMERIAGIKAEEVVGRHVSEPLKEGRFKTCVTLRALQTRQTVTLFDDYSNGKRCLNTSTPVFDANGNVWRVIAAIRDITELESLQTRLSNLEVEAMAYKLRVQGLENQSHSVLLGQSPLLQRTLQDITKAAQTDAVTLILGETGTGKTLAAKTIHEMSGRAQKPFIGVNCGAIPAALVESELFGYEKGAFTGASRNGKPGMLELAAGGTLLLDEIGELPLPMQAKLLHILDGEPIYRVGGTKPIKTSARIMAATNKSLKKMVGEGCFREDLFYRLRVLCVEMPPLRERRDDILLLAWHFLEKVAQESGLRKKLDPRVEQLFLAYAWPGNVRELQSVIQSLVTLCEHDMIMPSDLPSYMRNDTWRPPVSPEASLTLTQAVEKLERQMLASALAETGSTYKAARRLGVSQSSVVRKARKYGLGQSAAFSGMSPAHGEERQNTVGIAGISTWKN